jgi:hypothetical protein
MAEKIKGNFKTKKEQQEGYKKLYEYVDARFKEEFPDLVQPLFTIERTFKYFADFVYDQLLQEKSVTVYNLGKFRLVRRLNRYNNFQYYPKFKYSDFTIKKLRSMKGTATEAELKYMQEEKERSKLIWDKRVRDMLNKKGTVNLSFINYRKRIGIKTDWKEDFKEVIEQYEAEKNKLGN